MTPQDVQASNSVVAGTFLVNSQHARILFDPGATPSFISRHFASCIHTPPEALETPLLVTMPIGRAIPANEVLRSCVIRLGDDDVFVDLIILDMLDFDVILGMDWLASCYAFVDYRQKVITFQIPDKPMYVYYGSRSEVLRNLISALYASKLLKRVCECYLASVHVTDSDKCTVDQVPVVKDYPDVFPEEFQAISLEIHQSSS